MANRRRSRRALAWRRGRGITSRVGAFRLRADCGGREHAAVLRPVEERAQNRHGDDKPHRRSYFFSWLPRNIFPSAVVFSAKQHRIKRDQRKKSYYIILCHIKSYDQPKS